MLAQCVMAQVMFMHPNQMIEYALLGNNENKIEGKTCLWYWISTRLHHLSGCLQRMLTNEEEGNRPYC